MTTPQPVNMTIGRTSAPDVRRPLVLIAEDDVVQRIIFARILERSGFEVIAVEDGAGAIDLAQSHRPDLIILDAVMPNVGGFEAIAALRARPGLATTPVIVVSGLDDVQSRLNAFSIGADDFLTKPIDRQELIARARAQLRIVDAWRNEANVEPDVELAIWLDDVVRRSAFSIVFQPIVDLRSGRIVAQEALARFDDGTSPARVFGVAIPTDRHIRLEHELVEAALRQAGAFPEDVRVHVNVSPATARTRDLARLVAGSCRRVVLEITEHALFTATNVAALRDAMPPSCLLAADDVGAGYAGLSQLLDYRPDVLKIDRTVVTGVDTDPARQALVAGLVQFARATDSHVVAEGVERTEEWQTLRGLGVELGQGYLFARPAPLGETPIAEFVQQPVFREPKRRAFRRLGRIAPVSGRDCIA